MTGRAPFTVQPIADDAAGRAWLAPFMAERWGQDLVIAHGTAYRPSELPGFVAVARSRALEPSIPLVGEHGIPIRDELELELALEPER